MGVDGVSKEDYGQEQANLVERARAAEGELLRRVRGGLIGISAVEDKIVQGAIREVLEAMYEQDFRECSYLSARTWSPRRNPCAEPSCIRARWVGFAATD